MQEGLQATYAGPINFMHSSLTMALSQLAVFLRWITTPDDPPARHPTMQDDHHNHTTSNNSSSRQPPRGAADAVQRRAQHLL